MTASIQKKIDLISEKISQIVSEMNDLRQKNTDLEADVLDWKSKYQIAQTNLDSCKVELAEKTDALDKIDEQKMNSEVSVPSSNKNAEIDELVKEIEYCIGQLKK